MDSCSNIEMLFYPIWFIDIESIEKCYSQSFQLTNDEIKKSIQREIDILNKEINDLEINIDYIPHQIHAKQHNKQNLLYQLLAIQ